VCQSNDSRLTKFALADNLHEWYIEAALMLLNVSTFLDPRFKLPSYLSGEKIPVLKHLEQEVEDSEKN